MAAVAVAAARNLLMVKVNSPRSKLCGDEAARASLL
jgi:hypothetical protein